MSASEPTQGQLQSTEIHASPVRYPWLQAWGLSPSSSLYMSNLIWIQSMMASNFRTRQLGLARPLVGFCPTLIFSAGLNLIGGYKIDSASLSAISTAGYARYAVRRGDLLQWRHPTALGSVKLVALGFAVVHTVAGFYAWGTGDRRQEKEQTGRAGVFFKDLPGEK